MTIYAELKYTETGRKRGWFSAMTGERLGPFCRFDVIKVVHKTHSDQKIKRARIKLKR